MSLITTLIGDALEGVYGQVGSINLTNPTTALYTISAKLILIKAISQDLGSGAATTFLAGADTQLGPFATQVVDAVNGNESGAAAVVLSLLLSASPIASTVATVVETVAEPTPEPAPEPAPTIAGSVTNPNA